MSTGRKLKSIQDVELLGQTLLDELVWRLSQRAVRMGLKAGEALAFVEMELRKHNIEVQHSHGDQPKKDRKSSGG